MKKKLNKLGKEPQLNVRRLTGEGDQQELVLLSDFEFPQDEMVVMEDSSMKSEEQFLEIIESSEDTVFDILIIPRLRGG